ncbi:tyrosine-type recombinase/integrase [Desulfovibrio sp. OttesenSCG-928-G15]|nr:tyrosine-type recombinase/integrase [Desulfovibrio sp. OttesenSCG-928-G15]
MPPIVVNKLTDIKIKNLKPADKPQRHYDGGGLYLEVSPAGSKMWRMKYRIGGKEKRMAFGVWPAVSLKEARNKRDEAKRQLSEQRDPAIEKKRVKVFEDAPTFKEIADQYVEKQRDIWAKSHTRTVEGRLRLDVFPAFGAFPIAAIGPQDIIAMLRKIEDRRAFETASRVLGFCNSIFGYAVVLGAVQHNPCRDLRAALKPFVRGQFAAITDPIKVGALMSAIDDYKGSAVVRAALAYSALTFCRPGEIRHAEWEEIDFKNSLWTVPAEKMKGRIEHKVPLSRQALTVLKDIYPLTGKGRYVFPSPRGRNRPLSENGVLTALRNMGYSKEEMTAHGFRSMASSLLNELGHKPDVIEAQLAHKGYDKIRAVYNRAEYMQERRQLMQAWADYLDELRAAASGGASGSAA